MSETREHSLEEIEIEALTMVASYGCVLTLSQARDRVCDSLGWVNYKHCVECKAMRGVDRRGNHQ